MGENKKEKKKVTKKQVILFCVTALGIAGAVAGAICGVKAYGERRYDEGFDDSTTFLCDLLTEFGNAQISNPRTNEPMCIRVDHK